MKQVAVSCQNEQIIVRPEEDGVLDGKENEINIRNSCVGVLNISNRIWYWPPTIMKRLSEKEKQKHILQSALCFFPFRSESSKVEKLNSNDSKILNEMFQCSKRNVGTEPVSVKVTLLRNAS